ncbi:DUF3103 family protein [Massilia pseudoviolaceinigra]|uniref:DUF3103 family protein n=1 Tax=Massilia pseudoviolaceinigra TaxID=3057165 RepID=UPI0027967F32|nr:DUF3103 family protein [Massilia sp. CCM 9206]MDQ1924299.1 DUF3103 family protein [Massilia sp. CCM 9206]
MQFIQKALLTIVLAGSASAPVIAADRLSADYHEPRGGQTALVDQAKRFSAWNVARMLGDPQFARALDKRLAGEDKAVMLDTLLDDVRQPSAQTRASADKLRFLDQRVREHKAIARDSKNLLEVRLYVPRGQDAAARPDMSKLLVAYAPAGKRSEWSDVEAFDQLGQVQLLDARTPPAMPVLIVGINAREDMRAGMAYVNRSLRAAGLQSAPPKIAPKTASSMATGDIDTTRLDRVSLANSQESWVSGAAEVFAIVSGVQPDQAKAELSVVDMPYLDYAGTAYTPNQIMVFWSSYRYGAANIQLFEHDDNTNYKDLAVALSQSVSAILGVFAPSYAVIGQVATAILQAMPAGWFSNDDDYVDSFYTIERGRIYENHRGAANNATVTLSPYLLRAQ